MYGSLTQAKVIKEAALRSGVNQGVMKLETKRRTDRIASPLFSYLHTKKEASPYAGNASQSHTINTRE